MGVFGRYFRNLDPFARERDGFPSTRSIARTASSLSHALVLAVVMSINGHAKTPYEAQIAGFMYASLQTLITGEFAGRRPSQADASLNRRICMPRDYDDLRAAADDPAAFDAFGRRCHLIEIILDATHVHATAYLPAGYCATLKVAFEAVLQEQVYSVPRNAPGNEIVINYKGSHYSSTRRRLARRARLQVTCREDDSLRVSALRKLT